MSTSYNNETNSTSSERRDRKYRSFSLSPKANDEPSCGALACGADDSESCGISIPNGEVSRRNLLKLIGKGAAATVAAGVGVELLTYRAYAQSGSTTNPNGLGTNGNMTPGMAAAMADPAAPPDHQWAMVIDLRNCDGCGSCTAACQKAHYLTPDQTWIKVFAMTNNDGQTYHMPRPCMQCEDPPCLHVCPVEATFRTDQGVVLVNQDRCIGCRMCMAACPYEARYFNWTADVQYPTTPIPPTPQAPIPQKLGTVGKCTFCVGNLNNGLLSECASGCPMGAIYNADLKTDVAVNGLGNTVKLSIFLYNNDAVTFYPEQDTHPRVWYIVGHGQNLETNSTSA